MKQIFPLIFVAFIFYDATAQVPITQKSIQFEKGKNSAIVADAIVGDETIDYLLTAKEGQTMAVYLKTTNSFNYFNVLPPVGDTAIYNSSSGDNNWTGTLPESGTYRIRVYLMRNAARRNEKANFNIQFEITGTPAPTAHDAKVPGTPYHATGLISCSKNPEPKLGSQCTFGVIRFGGGRAEVHLEGPGARKNVLIIDGETVEIKDSTENISFSKKGYDWEILINDSIYYSIPEAVVIGG